jgi:hypothetical protein
MGAHQGYCLAKAVPIYLKKNNTETQLFRPTSIYARSRFKVLSTEQLETLGEEFLGFSDVSALLAWLDRSTGS